MKKIALLGIIGIILTGCMTPAQIKQARKDPSKAVRLKALPDGGSVAVDVGTLPLWWQDAKQHPVKTGINLAGDAAMLYGLYRAVDWAKEEINGDDDDKVYTTRASDGTRLSARSQAELDRQAALYEAGLGQGVMGDSNATVNFVNTGDIDGDVTINNADGSIGP